MNTKTIFEFGQRMAQEVCEGADHNSAYICEYEGFTGTAAETEFCKGWQTLISLSGEISMNQMLYRIKGDM